MLCLSCHQTIYDERDQPFGTCHYCREEYTCFKCRGKKGKIVSAEDKRVNVCSACRAEARCWNCGADLLDADELDKIVCHQCRL